MTMIEGKGHKILYVNDVYIYPRKCEKGHETFVKIFTDNYFDINNCGDFDHDKSFTDIEIEISCKGKCEDVNFRKLLELEGYRNCYVVF